MTETKEKLTPALLKERLDKIKEGHTPENCQMAMPEELYEAFDQYVMTYGMAEVSAPHHPVVLLTAAIAVGFWLGHDYALEHGQLRGDNA